MPLVNKGVAAAAWALECTATKRQWVGAFLVPAAGKPSAGRAEAAGGLGLQMIVEAISRRWKLTAGAVECYLECNAVRRKLNADHWKVNQAGRNVDIIRAEI